MQNPLGRSVIIRWSFILMMLTGSINAIAQSPLSIDAFQTLSLPDDPARNVGFDCDVRISSCNRPGYDTAKLTVTLAVAATAERRILMRLSPVAGEMVPQRHAFDIELPFLIEQNAKRVDVTRLVPKWTYGNSYTVQFLEDGRVLDGYVGEIGANLPNRRALQEAIFDAEVSGSTLLISELSDPQQIAAKVAALRVGLADPSQPMTAFTPANVDPRVQHMMLADTPTDWRTYQAHDCVVIDSDSLLNLTRTMPVPLRAMNQWLLLGGKLVVTGIDDDTALETLLRPSSSPGETMNGALAGYGVGAVFGYRSVDLETPQQWTRLRRFVKSVKSPALLRGVDPLFGDNRFRRWLIPGVAQPPVYTFMGLLTLFVILVGPVAYRMTTRRGRGYLMFAIAPILAILTTLSMFAYGIVADGFGTVARIRQITWIDAASGAAVTRTRGTYFAGIRPAAGLSFDADAEVMGYPDSQDQSLNDIMNQPSQSLGTVTIRDDEQRFSASFLPSRQQRQFVVHQAIEDVGSLMAVRSDDGAPITSPTVTLEVQSNLSIELKSVVIRDSRGDLWNIESLPAGSNSTVAAPIPAKDRSKTLGDLYITQRMMEEVSSGRRYQPRLQSYDLLSQLNQMFFANERELTDGGLENWLRNSLQLGGSIPNNSYIGLAAIEPRFIAVEDAELVDSIHFVFGTMPGANVTMSTMIADSDLSAEEQP